MDFDEYDLFDDREYVYQLPERAGRYSREALRYWAGEWLAFDFEGPPDEDSSELLLRDPLLRPYQRNFEDLNSEELIALSRELEQSILYASYIHDFIRTPSQIEEALHVAEIAEAWWPIVEEICEQALNEEYDREHEEFEQDWDDHDYEDHLD